MEREDMQDSGGGMIGDFFVFFSVFYGKRLDKGGIWVYFI